jgi:hypothetical protein
MDRDRLFKSDAVRLGVLAGLCLALGIYSIAVTALISKDGIFYIQQAQSLARDPLGVAHRHPGGYPLLLWIGHEIARWFGADDSAASWIHTSQGVTLACRLLSLIPLYFLGKLLIGGSRAFWAVLILIVLPYPARYGHDVLRDWPYVLFLSLGFWLLYWSVRRRAWWMFGVVGLVVALGYAVQPICAQLALYGLLACTVAAMSRQRGGWRPLTATVLLIVAFAGPALPYAWATGTLVPRQLRPIVFNSAPLITAVGGKGASSDPLEFEVRAGEALEIAVEASDAQGDSLSYSLAGVPVGSRPMFQLRLTATGARFQTLSEQEKDMLLDSYPPQTLEYEAIICYACAQPGAAAGLEPVHRFWSPTQGRHFYTIDPAEKDSIIAESPKDLWNYEGIAFYAFPEGRQPAGAVPVRRFWSERAGYFWAVAGQSAALVPDANAADDGVAWYVYVAGEPPAGMSLADDVLRWRPDAGQQGNHQVNIIVSDGRLESCQLVKINVIGSGTVAGSKMAPVAGSRIESSHRQAALDDATPSMSQGSLPERGERLVQAGLSALPAGADRLFDAIAEDLMVFFLLPWGLGLYYRLRYEADRLERVLTPTLIVVNAGLIVARHAWIGPGSPRRYALGLIALTIFYVPVGLERIAAWLDRVGGGPEGRLASLVARAPGPMKRVRWFGILMVIGVGICVPKLLTPLYADVRGYLPAIQWLRDNTQPDDTIAVTDNRLAFYADRQGLLYSDTVDPRRADYIVRIVEQDSPPTAPQGWSREYSLDTKDRRDRQLVIYKTHRRRD